MLCPSEISRIEKNSFCERLLTQGDQTDDQSSKQAGVQSAERLYGVVFIYKISEFEPVFAHHIRFGYYPPIPESV